MSFGGATTGARPARVPESTTTFLPAQRLSEAGTWEPELDPPSRHMATAFCGARSRDGVCGIRVYMANIDHR